MALSGCGLTICQASAIRQPIMENWNHNGKLAMDLVGAMESQGQWVIGLLPLSWKVVESMYEYLQTQIEVITLCISITKSANKNNNYEQPIAFFVNILAKNTFMNHLDVIYFNICWHQRDLY